MEKFMKFPMYKNEENRKRLEKTKFFNSIFSQPLLHFHKPFYFHKVKSVARCTLLCRSGLPFYQTRLEIMMMIGIVKILKRVLRHTSRTAAL